MYNHLKDETSPYLIQHAQNPVDWYAWGDEAFDKAKANNMPIFLSIGYSTCHWCHVMAHESFEDKEIADILNESFVSIKVDKEERPDIDAVYMSFCESFSGNGGWPMSVFMTPDQKPFFAGTYFPKTTSRGSTGFKELLLAIRDKWKDDADSLVYVSDEITNALEKEEKTVSSKKKNLIESALEWYEDNFDEGFGGFGVTPKFPTPHNLIFLLKQYRKNDDDYALEMACDTLNNMYRGGLFDHIGYGFCRYSIDRAFLIPHFEKMLYDNALLILAYCYAYDVTGDDLYCDIAEKTAEYLFTRMTSPEGGFYSAQDADSDGEEGKYYLFTPEEIIEILGREDGEAFNACFDITPKGNFEGKNIPNLLKASVSSSRFDDFLPRIRKYQSERSSLHTDDKILTFWNSLCIASLCALYRVTCENKYLDAAIKAYRFIEENMLSGDTLSVSYRDGKSGGKGFLDDYAGFSFALLSLYDATIDEKYLIEAKRMVMKAVSDFFDARRGGFYLYGKENESLILRPRESYDGTMPSGNSILTYALVRINALSPDDKIKKVLDKQIKFMSNRASQYPAGHAFFLTALSDYETPPTLITAVGDIDDFKELPFIAPLGSLVTRLDAGNEHYAQINGKATYYVCNSSACLEPTNELDPDDLS